MSNPIVTRMLLDAHVTALTERHNQHAARMRAMTVQTPQNAVESVKSVARSLADMHAPKHATGLYSLSDTGSIYARRLLLQAAASAFEGSTEGDVLRALDAWLTIAQRQRFYDESDAAALQGIKADMIEATETISEAIDALADQIDGA